MLINHLHPGTTNYYLYDLPIIFTVNLYTDVFNIFCCDH